LVLTFTQEKGVQNEKLVSYKIFKKMGDLSGKIQS